MVGRGGQGFGGKKRAARERQKLWRHSSCECNLWASVMCCSVDRAKKAPVAPHRSAAAITSGLLAAGTLAKSGGHPGQPAGGLGSGGPAAWDHWQGTHQLPSAAIRCGSSAEISAFPRDDGMPARHPAHPLLALSPLLWVAVGAIPHQLLQLAWHGVWQAQARLVVGLAQLLAHHLRESRGGEEAVGHGSQRDASWPTKAARPVAGHRSCSACAAEPAARTIQCWRPS